MALLALLIIAGALIAGAYQYATRPSVRAETNRTIRADPSGSLGMAVGVLLLFGFLAGLLFPPFGMIRLSAGPVHLALWQACGLAGVLFTFFAGYMANRRK